MTGTPTTRKGETKRQHYVPRFVLRKFSPDEHRVSLVVLASSRRIDNAPLKGQCYEDYFYGADNIMEKSFAEEEGKVSSGLGDLSRDHLQSLGSEALQQVRYFVWYQLARTKGAAEHLNKFIGAFVKSTIKGTMVLNHGSQFKPSDVDLVDVGYENAQNEAIWLACKSTPLLFDLAVKFITTDRTPGFVIGDHPVVAYNQFAEHHDILKHCLASTGLALKGLQLFMPLSPSVAAAVYDPAVYEFGGKSLVCRAGPTDVDYLNRMQAINALSCIYFDPRRVTPQMLEDIQNARRAHPSLLEKRKWEGPMVQLAAGKISQHVAVAKREIRVGAKFSFIRTLDGHSYVEHAGVAMPVRNRELVEFTHEYGEHLERTFAAKQAAQQSGAPPGDDRPPQ